MCLLLCCNRSPQSKSVTSSQLLLNFTVDQLNGWWIGTLSIFKDKVLISRPGLSQMFIYSREGRHLLTVTTVDNDALHDACWTPRGNIVYVTDSNKRVVVMSSNGDGISTPTNMTKPRSLSVSIDNIIYLCDWEAGVYQSINDGISWSLVFKSPDGWHWAEVIKVSTDPYDNFWIRGWQIGNDSYRLGSYNMNGGFSEIITPTTDGIHIDLLYSSLAQDGHMNIFLSDYHNKAVHVFSVNGQYQRQLLSPDQLNSYPFRLAVDKERQLLYAGQWDSKVGIFKLLYENGG